MSTLIPSKAGGTSDLPRAWQWPLPRRPDLPRRPPSRRASSWSATRRAVRRGQGKQGARPLRGSGIPKFGLAIDWGWFRWFEKPIFLLLTKLFELAGNFGVAIILLTLIVRGVMFPVAQKQFASMAAMRAIQPKMKALQERYKDDKQKQQQEIMALYKRRASIRWPAACRSSCRSRCSSRSTRC
jgi:hypothetical protein